MFLTLSMSLVPLDSGCSVRNLLAIVIIINLNCPRTRGRKSIITSDQIREMEHILETEGIAARSMTWEQLGQEVGVDVCGKTIQRTMGAKDYRKCIACQKGWVSPDTAAYRMEFARRMLDKYPTTEDWIHVRLSDEVHFGWGSQG